MSPAKRIDAAIVVALPEEFDHLLAWVSRAVTPVPRAPGQGGYDYEFRLDAGGDHEIRCVGSLIGDMGPDRAALHTERLLERWNPRLLCVVGIAAGIHDDVRLGDVVAADQIDAYLAISKAVDSAEGAFSLEHRGRVYTCDHELAEEIRHFRFVWPTAFARWQGGCRERLEKLALRRPGDTGSPPAPGLHVAHLASGPVLSSTEGFVGWLRGRDSKLYALDMESAGVVAAAHERGRSRTLVLRGISDRGDVAKAAVEKDYKGDMRAYAMQNALGFLHLLLVSQSLGARTSASVARARKRFAASRLSLLHGDEPRPEIIRRVCAWLATPCVGLARLQGLRVLHVEDDEMIVRAVGTLLAARGVHCTSTGSGLEAMQLLQSIEVDAAILDRRMPGMEGMDVCVAIRAKLPGIPITMFTAYAEECGPERWGFTGGTSLLPGVDYILKPAPLDELLMRLATHARDEDWTTIWHESPEFGSFFPRLVDCKQTLSRLLCTDQEPADALVASALRHKAQDCLQSFQAELVKGGDLLPALTRLQEQAHKVTHLAEVVRSGSKHGLFAYLDAYQQDLTKTYRSLDLTIEAPSDARSEVAPEVATILLLACVELIDNAREALGNSGTICVKATRWITREALALTVWSNSGPLEDSVAARLFEEGFSTRGRGRGLGLALVKRLVERVSGSISCTSRDGVEFCVTVPHHRRARLTLAGGEPLPQAGRPKMPSSAQREGGVGSSDGTLLLVLLDAGTRFDVQKHEDRDGLCRMSVTRENAERARLFVKKQGQLLDDDVPAHAFLQLSDVRVNQPSVASEIVAKILA